ncbi:uncharacterized protein LOC136081642 isoform X5 [Hydra vulgaris]|uniref:Uncharacterized protein LOC136081642 isoform X5 n=1 Tax=Hydra vulgaris TaxID=6087 RepID=A0ABM4C150_HYDVU
MVSQQADPNPGCRKYSVRSLGKAATYERAREKLKLSENLSDLNLTENENTEKATGVLKRKRVSTQCFQFDSDSEEYSDVLQKQILKSLTAKSHTKSSIAKKGALSTSILLPPPPQIVHRQLPVSNDSNSQDISFQIVPSKKTLLKKTSSYSFSSSPLPERPSQLREQSSFSTPTSSSDHNIEAIKRNVLTSKTNVRDVEIGLSNWLTGSRDRDGNRAKRAKASKNKRFRQDVSPDVSGNEESIIE